MCTVTYLPKGKQDFILTTNRDEAPARSPKDISCEERAGQQLAFPRDETAGGTWVAVSDANRIVCILNGAFEKHRRNPPYRRSRGLMALDFFEFPRAEDFLSHYTFEGMEPFTMLIVERGKLLDFRWDEKKKHLNWMGPQRPHIWSSTPLYEPEIRRKREQWFADWLKEHKKYSREAILDFHRNAGEGDPWNDVVMNRGNMVRTVSITNIVKEGGEMDMQYHDLLHEQARHAKIKLKSEVVG